MSSRFVRKVRTASGVVAVQVVSKPGGRYSSVVAVRIVSDDLPIELARWLRNHDHVAVDTETTGLDWRINRLKLCQLCCREGDPVLVRLAGAPAPNLVSVLEDPAIAKVFHHAPFDLRFIEAHLGARTTPVRCTKTASKLLTPGAAHDQHSLKTLLKQVLGVNITKGTVRASDWGTESLTPEQLRYAAADVSHLLPLFDALSQRLRETGLTGEYDAICAYLPLDAHLEVSGVPNPLIY